MGDANARETARYPDVPPSECLSEGPTELLPGDLRPHPGQRPFIDVMKYVGFDGFEIGSWLECPPFVATVDTV